MTKKINNSKDDGVEDYLPMVNDLIKKIRNKPEWTEEDEVRLKKLDKLLGIMNKLAVLEKKYGKSIKKLSRAGDAAIIKRYLKRKEKDA